MLSPSSLVAAARLEWGWWGPMTVLAISTAGTVAYFLYSVLVVPRLSPNRHLPAPDQGPVWRRLLHEPEISEVERWLDEGLSHRGLFRYHGIFNRERVLVASPEVARDFLNQPYRFVKPELQWQLANNIADVGLLIQEGEAHKRARKLTSPAFSPALMREWLPALWQTTIAALDAVPAHTAVQSRTSGDDDDDDGGDGATESSFSGTTRPIRLLSAASIDMIGKFAFGHDFATIEQVAPRKRDAPGPAPTRPLRERFGRAYIHMFKCTRRGEATLRAASLIGAGTALCLPLRAVRTIHGIMSLVRTMVTEMVTEHVQAEAKTPAPARDGRRDMLSVLLRSGQLSQAELVTQSVHILAAGTETVAGSITWAVHLLSRRPDVQARLRAEIRAHIGSPSAAGIGEAEAEAAAAAAAAAEDMTEARLMSLPYLNAVVKETLRFHSVNTLLWRQCVQSTTVAGVPIPRGTVVLYSPWMLNRDPGHWGPDARSFNPERWLRDPTTGGADDSYAFLTFGGGPRRCPGERYARNEMLCLLAAMFGRYEFLPLAAGGTDDGDEIADHFALTLSKIYEEWELRVRKVPGW